MSEEGVIDILTPASVQTRQFSERRKGYDPQEVDEFLDEVTHTLTDLGGRLDAAAAHVQRVEAEVSELRAEQERLSVVPAADPGEVAALTQQVASLQEQMQALVEQARVAEEARAAAAAGYEEASSRATALAEQIEAARAAHLRQQSTITALTSEVDYWKAQLEDAREAAKPPMELSNALEVLAAAQLTAERMRLEAEQEAAQIRAQVNDEAGRLRLDFQRLRDVEAGLRADVAALAYGVIEWLSGEDLSFLPEVEQFDETQAASVVAGASDSVVGEIVVDGAPTEVTVDAEASQFAAWASGNPPEVPSESPTDLSEQASGFDAWTSPAPEVEATELSSDAGGWATPDVVVEPAESSSREEAASEGGSADEAANAWGAPLDAPAQDAPFADWSAAAEQPVAEAPDVESASTDAFGSWGAPQQESVESSGESTWGEQPSTDDPYGFNN